MEIIRGHQTPSKHVGSYTEIRGVAEEAVKFLEAQSFDRNQIGLALHHAQVCETPYNFFVIDLNKFPEMREVFESPIIVNPEVVKMNGPEVGFMEGCLTFPWRKEKIMKRDLQIEVQYQYPKESPIIGWRLVKVKKNLTTLAAFMFQHETDHGRGKNIYNK